MTNMFLGHEISYWAELEKRFIDADVQSFRREQLLKEIIALRQKVAFYESRLDEMMEIRK